MEFSRDRNSVSSLQAHLVFVTKYRRKILTQESSRLIEESFQSVAKGNALKGVSSRKYGQAKLPKPYGKAALWSPSYFVSSVGGAPLKVLVAYMQNQEKPPY
jgi:putative transposase